MRRRKTNSKITKRSLQSKPPRDVLRREQLALLRGSQSIDCGMHGACSATSARLYRVAEMACGRFPVIPASIRRLSDFAKLVEIFDRRGVSFVSITQQFNTTTSMGRLTLNILLSLTPVRA